MSYNKCHTDIGYENEPSVETPLNETNLNYTDHCVDILDDRVVALDVAKLAVSEANSFITNITMNDATGIFTITKRDGTSYTIDTKLEKIAVNFRYDSATQKLIITLSDGTTQEVDLSSLITENEFTDSTTIAFTVVGHNVSATVKAGSITDSMLESGFLAAAQAAKSGAELAKSGADASALKAEGFAVGQQGGIDVPSTSPYHDNNAKFYAEQAETSAANAANSEDNASDYASAASTSATNASNSASAASTSAGNASTSATNASNSADAAADSATEASEYAASASGSASTATSKASEASGYATSANDSRLESEGYAVGTQDGVEVPSTSPYYHNNAKYYAEQSGGQMLSALNDVQISSVADGQALVYDSELQKWVNGEASIDVIDNLTSTSTTDALSANQGRVLNQKKADSGYPTEVLPSAYQRVEYLESHGVEAVNTNITIGQGFIFKGKIAFTTVSSMSVFIGEAGDSDCFSGVSGSREPLFRAGSSSLIYAQQSVTPNTKYDVILQLLSGNQRIEYQTLDVITGSYTFNINETIFIFAGNNSGTIYNPSHVRLYEGELYDKDENLVAKYIPAIRNSDNVRGLYDIVTDTFLTNIGTGTFGVGADVVPKTLKEVEDNTNGRLLEINDILNGSPNIWDETWEAGEYYHGTKNYKADRIRSVGYIKVNPSTKYWATRQIVANYYDSSKTWLSDTVVLDGGEFITPNNCYYMTFFAVGSTYTYDISINYPLTDHSYHRYVNGLVQMLANILPLEYSTSTSYPSGAVCMHEGKMMQNTSGNTVSGAWNANYWTQARLGNMATLGYTEVQTW